MQDISVVFGLCLKSGCNNSPGEAALIVGPESVIFASDVSRIDRIFTSLDYRESADPSYPGNKDQYIQRHIWRFRCEGREYKNR